MQDLFFGEISLTNLISCPYYPALLIYVLLELHVFINLTFINEKRSSPSSYVKTLYSGRCILTNNNAKVFTLIHKQVNKHSHKNISNISNSLLFLVAVMDSRN